MDIPIEATTPTTQQITGLLSNITDCVRFVDAEPHRSRIHPLVFLVLGTLMLWGSIGFMWIYLPLAWPEEIPSQESEQLSVVLLFIAPVTVIGLFIWFLRVLEQFVLGPIFYALSALGDSFSNIVAGWLCLGPVMIEWRHGGRTISRHHSQQLTNFGSSVLATQTPTPSAWSKWLPITGLFAVALFLFLIPALLVIPLWTPVDQPYFGPVLITAGVLGYASWQTAKVAFLGARALLKPSAALTSYQTSLNEAWNLALLGTRYRDFPGELLSRAATFSRDRDLTPIQQLSLHEICILAAIDRGESRVAAEWIASAADIVNSLHVPPRAFISRCWLMFDEAAYFTARYSQNLETSVWWLSAANRYPWIERYRRLASEAAILLAQGDIEGARQRAEASIRCSEQALLPVDGALVRARMSALLSITEP